MIQPPDRSPSTVCRLEAPPGAPALPNDGHRLVVGIGEFAVADRPEDVIITHALGSCVAVCVWEPSLKVGGLLHYLLPESRINPERAAQQPAVFADVGIPLLFKKLAERGVNPRRAQVKLAGGAEIAQLQGNGALNVGRRNALAAKEILWRLGVLVRVEALGGNAARTVWLRNADGVLTISSGGVKTEI
jgi:chemotaxis protein CheD